MKTDVADQRHTDNRLPWSSQLVSFDRDASLWRTHTVPRASHACTGPTLPATSVTFSTAGLATIVFFSSNPQLGPKYDRRDHSEWNHPVQYFERRNCGRFSIRGQHFDIVQQSRLIHDICSAILSHLHDSTRPYSGQARAWQAAFTILPPHLLPVSRCVFRLSEVNRSGSTLPLRLVSVQKFVS